MRTFKEIDADASDRPAFANSTEGYAWTGNWCGDCVHDAPARRGDDGNGCPLILVTLMGKTPVEFLDQREPGKPYRLGDQYHCIEYRPEDDGDGPTQPEDPMPGQGELLPRDPYERPKMFTDVVHQIKEPAR